MAPAAWPTTIVGAAAGTAEGAVLGARRDARRSGGARTSSPIRCWPSWASCRPSTTPRSSAPSTRPSRAPRWCSCAGCARARSSKKTTCATARPSCTGCWPHRRDRGAACATARPITCSRASSASAQGVGEMLREVQRIKTRGRLRRRAGAVRDLRRALRPGAARRDRARGSIALNLPSYTGFVMPTLTPVYDADGAITDVQISYSLRLRDADAQLFEEHRRRA